MPGYDVHGKLWTVQYIKEDGTKRFAKDSQKHGCFHVVGAASASEGLQKLAVSPVIAIAEGYATAATVAKYGNVPAVAAFDSGNLLAVATALHDRFPDKRIMIAGDDDHKLENNPGRVKALEAALAAHGMVVFPNSTEAKREKGNVRMDLEAGGVRYRATFSKNPCDSLYKPSTLVRPFVNRCQHHNVEICSRIFRLLQYWREVCTFRSSTFTNAGTKNVAFVPPSSGIDAAINSLISGKSFCDHPLFVFS